MWELRSVYVHQAMIEERCNTLKIEGMRCVNTLMSAAGITVKSETFLSFTDTDVPNEEQGKAVHCR